ncbi:MAG: hypothetical protein ABIJ91_01465 [Candidatus Kuenenbacteria bacterium]
MNNHFITLNNKKYPYALKPSEKDVTFVKCEAAKISQEFLNEDIPNLLNDLPNLILAEKNYNKEQIEMIRFRVNPKDKRLIEKKATQKGYSTVSAFLRDLALNT